MRIRLHDSGDVAKKQRLFFQPLTVQQNSDGTAERVTKLVVEFMTPFPFYRTELRPIYKDRKWRGKHDRGA